MKIDLVILPMHDWKKCAREGFRTRDAHIIQHFEKNAKVNKILVVDRPVSLPEMVINRRNYRIKDGELIKRTPASMLTRVSQSVFVLSLLSRELLRPLILKRDWWDHIFRRPAVIRRIQEAMSLLDMDQPVLFLWSPLSTGVIGHLEERAVVFDALDNWSAHPEIEDSRGYVRRGYDTLRRRADVIFALSEETRQLMNNPRTPPILIPNGVDKEFFHTRTKVIPEDLKSIPRPIVGYSGKLAKRIDTALLEYLAGRMPQVSFVLAGPILDRKWVKPLFNFENMYFLGDKHYSRLPLYINCFDLCIIPHNVRELENGGDPIKLYEYLAAGKPVVTTNIQGVDRFSDIITVARGPDEFARGITYWLQRIQEDGRLAGRLRNAVSDSDSWANKAGSMVEAIIERLEADHRI